MRTVSTVTPLYNNSAHVTATAQLKSLQTIRFHSIRRTPHTRNQTTQGIVSYISEKKNSCRNSSRKHGKVCLEHGALLSFASHRRFSLQCPCYVACNSHAQTTAARIKHAQGERVGILDNSLLGPRRPLRRHVIRSMGLAGSSSLVYTLASSST
jgi:hypothetical protein